MTREQIKQIMDAVCEKMKEISDIILSADRSGEYIDEKSGYANFVTKYDTKVQEALKVELKAIFSEAMFVGEEGDCDEYNNSGYAFIVDPIDGTTNFIHDYRVSCISIALIEDGERIAGAVYDPYSDRMYTAIKGCGAFCNDKPIHVSKYTLDKALVIFGTAPYYEELRKASYEKAYEISGKCVDLRRSGSAALDLCHIAEGSADMFFEYRLCAWDYAAASLIVEEAGGVVTGIDGGPIILPNKMGVIATNGVIKPTLEV